MSNIKNWYQIIRNHVSKGSPKEALHLYSQLRQHELFPIEIVPFIAKACTYLTLKNYGKSLHAETIKNGVDCDVIIGTSLLSMYAKCRGIGDARKLFDEMPQRTVVTWNAMLGGYLVCRETQMAVSLFENMPERTVVTWNEVVRGFSRIGDMKMARALFDRMPVQLRDVVSWTVMVDGYASNGDMEAARMIFEAMPERNCFVWSVMINGYCKRGEVEHAWEIFERCPVTNLVVWNSIISGFAQNGFCKEAIEAFGGMQINGFEPDEVSVTSVLSACSQLGALDVGREVHSLIYEKGIKLNKFILNGLIDMYAKCGDLGTASSIFEGMSERNSACWNSMISGFASHGKSEEAVEFFCTMEGTGPTPDEISFLSVLSACAHGGLVEEGLSLFSKMEKYGVQPGVKHYGCVIDLLGRAGKLKQAFDLVKNMPMKPNDMIWGSLLGACRVHTETTFVEEVKEHIDCLGSSNDSHYVLLSNIYAATHRWEKAEDIRTSMTAKSLQKTPGSSSFL